MATNFNFPVGTAAVSWFDSSGSSHIRVYSTDGYKVSERCWDGSAWTDGAFAQAGSNVSATCWQNQDGPCIRVYCNFQDKTLEYCWDAGGSGWYQGTYTTS
ncbi:hypothetical protein ACFQRC_13770 [Enterovirga sp. GCM10030262]|uniref:hypothetical protein n=1 Tax=Enterovirga sp. GCM10030262 TaxID=3273391 RepID=UPI00360A6FBD